MNETKLTDFSKAELKTLLEVVVLKIVNEECHRKEWLKRFATAPDMYYDNQPERLIQYNHLQLWRVQILTAIGKVGVREEIAQN